MSEFESDILHELKIGEIYTTKQIIRLLAFNDVTVISLDTERFYEMSDIKFKVENAFNGYISGHKEPNTYVQPSRNKKIYIISKA
ncbi:hypothetical protein Ccar_16135 [Clostridium carboxidivorans P7]|uniref:Uncharacterized protein n=1 Tax=Clostridium carboxidivorans P7 TaxID=536227 RepID=C6Q154_9CLOT|nr:hypothetical protein [Clostridium carboxidivorans]AKN32308.1 hypothetical protein Ccar_16135 [Clostridium carboxidivorans P7]EET84790.1 hypothetical protein CcarbDRAFT_4771 [Clostridium carboxidivorans P7]